MTKLKCYTGYRSEEPYGSGIRNIFDVTNHEIKELGNNDILEILEISKRKLKHLFKKLFTQGYKECIWLCDKASQVYKLYEARESIEKYTIKNEIILSDIGEYGKLIAYKTKEIKCH